METKIEAKNFEGRTKNKMKNRYRKREYQFGNVCVKSLIFHHSLSSVCEIGGVMKILFVNIMMAEQFPSYYSQLTANLISSFKWFRTKMTKRTRWTSRCLEMYSVWLCHFTSHLIEMISFYLFFCLRLPSIFFFHFIQCYMVVRFAVFPLLFRNLWTFLLNCWHFCLICMDRYIHIERNQYSPLPEFVTVIQCKTEDIEFNIIVRTLFVEFQSDCAKFSGESIGFNRIKVT